MVKKILYEFPVNYNNTRKARQVKQSIRGNAALTANFRKARSRQQWKDLMTVCLWWSEYDRRHPDTASGYWGEVHGSQSQRLKTAAAAKAFPRKAGRRFLKRWPPLLLRALALIGNDQNPARRWVLPAPSNPSLPAELLYFPMKIPMVGSNAERIR